MNPGPARSVSPVAVSAARKGLGSDEETGVRRGSAGRDRPRLHADGARVRQARGGGPSGARPLVPDGNRGVPAPEVAAAVCAGAAGEVIPEPSSCLRIARQATGQLAGRKLPGTGNPRRAPPCSGSPGRIKIINRPRRLRSRPRYAFLARSGPICVNVRVRVARGCPSGKRLTIEIVYPDCARGYCRQYVPGDRRPALPRFGSATAREPRATM